MKVGTLLLILALISEASLIEEEEDITTINPNNKDEEFSLFEDWQPKNQSKN